MESRARARVRGLQWWANPDDAAAAAIFRPAIHDTNKLCRTCSRFHSHGASLQRREGEGELSLIRGGHRTTHTYLFGTSMAVFDQSVSVRVVPQQVLH